MKTAERREKETCNKQKKGTNFVGSQKQVVTYEKAAQNRTKKMPAAKKPNTKSRLFDYEASHQSQSKPSNKNVTFASDIDASYG